MDVSRELAPGENPAGVSYQSERGEIAAMVCQEYTVRQRWRFDRFFDTR
jgi:hypothetical protein